MRFLDKILVFPLHDLRPAHIILSRIQRREPINDAVPEIQLVGELVQHHIHPVVLVPTADPGVRPRKYDRAILPRLTQRGILGFVDHADLIHRFILVRHEVTRKDQNRFHIVEIVVLDPEQQQAGLTGNGHPHFVGDRNAPAALPMLLGDEHLHQTSKAGLFVVAQNSVMGNAFFQPTSPAPWKRSFQDFSPSAFSEPIKNHDPENLGGIHGNPQCCSICSWFVAKSPNLMPRKLSSIAPDWWDYTTIDDEIVRDAAALTPRQMARLSRPGFKVLFYDTLEEFYLAEALEYIEAWRQSTTDNPVGICGPIGPTEQLPLVARIVNALNLDIRSGHFWGMDEWVVDGRVAPPTHPLSFEKADREMCFNRIPKKLRMPDANLHFPDADTREYRQSWNSGARCAVMQGGQGDVKHWAFNDPVRRQGKYRNQPPSPAEYRKLTTRVVDLHPMTISQNARTSGGGNISMVPTRAVTVGPVETWQADKVSIWQAGSHDNAFGMRLTTLMIAKGIADSAVPMSLLADHPNVQFNFYRGGIGSCDVAMH